MKPLSLVVLKITTLIVSWFENKTPSLRHQELETDETVVPYPPGNAELHDHCQTPRCFMNRPGIQSTKGTVMDDCSNFEGLDQCQSPNQTYYNPDEVRSRRFQTQSRYDKGWEQSYQDYSVLSGYATLDYESSRTSARVRVITYTKIQTRLWFKWGHGADPVENLSEMPVSMGSALGSGPLVITVFAYDLQAQLILEPVDFVWNNPWVQSRFNLNGRRGAIIEMFGWPYHDIELECANYLGQAGYMGVKIPPPNEHVESDHYLMWNGELNPWWFVYQPVSYKLQSRLGTRDELRSMIKTCRQNGVRVYADAVINHMAGHGNDILNHRNFVRTNQSDPTQGYCAYWGAKNGTAQSPFYTHGFTYELMEKTQDRPALEFPAVPYTMDDFHCYRRISRYDEPFDLNYGWLADLADLATEKPNVQDRISTYLADLISIGFSGFRIDAAKHIHPDDIASILGQVKQKLGGNLPGDFLVYLEVMMNDKTAPWLACNITERGYNYFEYLDQQLAANGLIESEIEMVKRWGDFYPVKNNPCDTWVLKPSRFVIANDDHDQQEKGELIRKMDGKGSILVREKDVIKHREFEVKLFTQTDIDADIRLILSSYTFASFGAHGFPDGKSDCGRFKGNSDWYQYCNSISFSRAFEPRSQGYDVFDESGQWKGGVYTRVHRDPKITSAMQKWLND